jgi:hypothetical protein
MSDLREQLENWRQHYSITPTAMDALVSALDAQPAPANEPRAPSYHALLIIAQSVCGALDRAGITDCDDPGEAIDVMRERYEKRIAELETAQPAPGGEVAVPEGWVLVPRKMTAAMNDAAMLKWKRAPDTTMGSVLWEIMYDAMLAAAPQPATVKRDLTVQQPEAETRADEVETIGAALFRDWDAGDHREGGPFEYYRGIIRDFVVKIRQPGDIREPKPAEGGVVAWITDHPAVCNGGFTRDKSIADAWRANGWNVTALAPAGSESADYECRAHECRRVRVEMQEEIDRLRAGSGEAVGVVCLTPDSYAHGAMVELQVQLSPGANIKRGTKLYAGAPPAAEDTEIANRVRAMQGALKKTDKPLAYACALALANIVADSNAERGRFVLEGVTQDGERRGDWTVLVLAGIVPPADAEALIRECVPGGDICDPQQVADNIREYFGRLSGGEG